MKRGHFCFLRDQYYKDFPDDKLMKNKEVIDGISHNRPCFFAFPDRENPEILWLVPISTKYEKYKAIYDKKAERYGYCNTIRFGEVLGRQSAFLIQNICPVTEEYINNIYVDRNNNPVSVDERTEQDVIQNAQAVIERVKRGATRIVFPDVMSIYSGLEQRLKREKSLTPEEEMAEWKKRLETAKAADDKKAIGECLLKLSQLKKGSQIEEPQKKEKNRNAGRDIEID